MVLEVDDPRVRCRASYGPACLLGTAPPWHASSEHPARHRLACCARYWLAKCHLDANDQHWRAIAHEQLQQKDENWRPDRLRTELINAPLLLSDMFSSRVAHAGMLNDLNLIWTNRSAVILQQACVPGGRSLLIATVQQRYLLPHLLRSLHHLFHVHGGRMMRSRLPLALSVVSRDDMLQPDAEAARLWCRLSATVTQLGGSARLFVQNAAANSSALAMPWPLGIYEVGSLNAFVTSRAGSTLATATEGRSTLLLCCCMKHDGVRRRHRLAIWKVLAANGFDCNVSALPPTGSIVLQGVNPSAARPLRGYDDAFKGSLWRYYTALARSKFVLAPYGEGRDSYRIWEALACGAAPVMIRDDWHGLDHRKLAGLPILWVRSWRDVTPRLLAREWRAMMDRAHEYDMRRLHAPYWLAQLLQLPAGSRQDQPTQSILRSNECAKLSSLVAKGERVTPRAWLGAAVAGHCGVTLGAADCSFADQGALGLTDRERSSWELATAACIAKCTLCRRCRYVTISRKYADCSWYSRCTNRSFQSNPARYGVDPVFQSGAVYNRLAAAGSSYTLHYV